jgi:Ser/Thr protein kinase RdoA (MazF antagonist)
MTSATRVTHRDLIIPARWLRRVAMCDDPQLPRQLREKYRRLADELTRDLDSCRQDLLHQEVTDA